MKIPRLYNRNAPSELNSTTYIVTEEGMSYAHCKIWTCLNDFLTKISSAENFEVEEILVCLGFETGHICIYFHLNNYFFNYEFEAFLSKISQCAELVHHCTAVTIAQNLHWKLGQQTPSVGILWPIYRLRLKLYIF